MEHLSRTYRHAQRIHVIVDNYSVRRSRQTTLALRGCRGVKLHVLPPYAPQFDQIERLWLDLHAEFTRNHRCATIDELMDEIDHYLGY